MTSQGRKIPFVQASSGIKPSIAQGHPWIYRDAIERAAPELETGQWVHVQCGNLQLYGLWDAEGSIAVRLFGSRQRPNRAWVDECVAQAWARRAHLRRPQSEVSAYRWLFGESDGLPGIVVDLYGDLNSGQQWAIVRTYNKSVEGIKAWIVESLPKIMPLAGVVQRDDQTAHLLQGILPSQPIVISEFGVHFEVDLLHGQKTGFFLDQRDNRQTVGAWSRNRTVLNLFSYTGGFSLFAALGGAPAVTSVDSASAAMATAERNFVRNGLEVTAHEFVIADCFELLQKYYSQGRRFDLVIVDPPSFAHNKAQLPAALHAYRRLNTLAMQCLNEGGLLASSSCTGQVSLDAFRQMLASASADAKRRTLILHEAGQPLDHPVPAHFPEARYLKFVIAAVEPLR